MQTVDIYVSEDHWGEGEESTQDVHINGNSYPSLEFVFAPGHWQATLVTADGYITDYGEEE